LPDQPQQKFLPRFSGLLPFSSFLFARPVRFESLSGQCPPTIQACSSASTRLRATCTGIQRRSASGKTTGSEAALGLHRRAADGPSRQVRRVSRPGEHIKYGRSWPGTDSLATYLPPRPRPPLRRTSRHVQVCPLRRLARCRLRCSVHRDRLPCRRRQGQVWRKHYRHG
jgi:hypothetical protein